jgi:hypothetical protein
VAYGGGTGLAAARSAGLSRLGRVYVLQLSAHPHPVHLVTHSGLCVCTCVCVHADIRAVRVDEVQGGYVTTWAAIAMAAKVGLGTVLGMGGQRERRLGTRMCRSAEPGWHLDRIAVDACGGAAGRGVPGRQPLPLFQVGLSRRARARPGGRFLLQIAFSVSVGTTTLRWR